MNANAANPKRSTRAQAEHRWRRVVEALGFRTKDNGQTYGPCPVHDGDNESAFSVGVGEEGWPVFDCKTGCADEIAHDRDGWYAKARRALLAAGVPEDCLAPAPGARRRSTRRVARIAGRTSAPRATAAPPSEDLVEHRASAMTEGLTKRLATNRGLTVETIEAAGIGWDAEHECYVLPVRDPRTTDLNDLQTYRIGGKLRHRAGGTARLYAPPSVDLSEQVLVCEGAWDALTAWQHGLNAVAVTGGAGTLPRDLSALEGCDAVIVFDCDDEGRAGAQKLAAALQPIARSLTIADLGLPDKGDVRDWFVKHRRSKRALQRVVRRAKPWRPEVAGYSKLGQILTRADLATLPKPEPLIEDMLSLRSYVLMVGRGDTNKTFVALGFACCCATGTPWRGRVVKTGAVNVLYVVGEGAYGINDRIAAWERENGVRVPPDMLTVLMKPASMSDGELWEQLADLARAKAARLVVFDTFSSLAPDADETQDASRITRQLSDLAAAIDGTALLLHHTGWGPQDRARGGSQFEHNADEVLVLQRADDEDSHVVSLKRKKVKDGPGGEALWLRRVELDPSCVMELAEEPAGRAVGRRSRAEDKLRNLIFLCLKEKPTTKTAVRKAVREQAVAEGDTCSTEAFDRAWKGLAERGEIQEERQKVPEGNPTGGAVRSVTRTVWAAVPQQPVAVEL